MVNDELRIKCYEKNFTLIDNDNITLEHLNGSGIHLNVAGTETLALNFLHYLRL